MSARQILSLSTVSTQVLLVKETEFLYVFAALRARFVLFFILATRPVIKHFLAENIYGNFVNSTCRLPLFYALVCNHFTYFKSFLWLFSNAEYPSIIIMILLRCEFKEILAPSSFISRGNARAFCHQALYPCLLSLFLYCRQISGSLTWPVISSLLILKNTSIVSVIRNFFF